MGFVLLNILFFCGLLFVSFPLAVVLAVLRFTAFDYSFFGIF